jgi:transcriptional regulator with XRE-family HTH domain
MFLRMASRGVKGMGARMVARREHLNLSQADVAQRVGGKTSLEQISHYEHERRSPGAQAIVDLARALECSTDYLLGVKELPQKRPTVPAVDLFLADARRQGTTYAVFDGQPYRLRKDGWEPV